jgi:prevent-host-death family protein
LADRRSARPRLFGVEPPQPRIEAVQAAKASKSWAEFAPVLRSSFSELLSQVERGEEVIILKHGNPVAVYRSPVMTPERRQAIDHAIEVITKGLPWGRRRGRFKRDEIHER